MIGKNSSWLKDNLFVVAALVLPFIVIGFFLAATGIPRFFVDAPKHDLLFSVEWHQNEEFSLSYRVVDGKLRARVRLVSNSNLVSAPHQTLYQFDARTLRVRKIVAEIPGAVIERLREQTGDERIRPASSPPAPLARPVPPQPYEYPSEEFEVIETAKLKLMGDPVAPDGYEFKSIRSTGRGLFGDLFGMGRGKSDFSVARNGRVIALPIPEGGAHYRHYYLDANFLGWVAN